MFTIVFSAIVHFPGIDFAEYFFARLRVDKITTLKTSQNLLLLV